VVWENLTSDVWQRDIPNAVAQLNEVVVKSDNQLRRLILVKKRIQDSGDLALIIRRVIRLKLKNAQVCPSVDLAVAVEL
jgi:hypothetical protein